MIEIVEAVGHHIGKPDWLGPMIICDPCREPIINGGAVLWAEQHDVDWLIIERSPFYFTHNEGQECHLRLERALEARYPAANHWGHPWRMLSEFFEQLTKNYRTDPRTDPEYLGYRFEIPTA